MERSERGMTLVELIVAVAVSAVLLVGIASIFSQGLKTQQQQAARDDLTGQLNAVSSILNESIRISIDAEVNTGNSRINMVVMKQSGAAVLECQSFVISENKLWMASWLPGSGGQLTFRPGGYGWKAIATGIVQPDPEGSPAGFIEDDGAFFYDLTMKSGDVEVSIHDGGYPRGQLRIANPGCGG